MKEDGGVILKFRYPGILPRAGPAMYASETAYLRTMWDRHLCPTCHSLIANDAMVGSGNKADGRFCSLHCFATYHALSLAQRTNLLRENSQTDES
jgi:hypothetical protein